MSTPDITSVITNAFSGFGPILLAVAPVGLGIFLITWGLPKGIAFAKKLASK